MKATFLFLGLFFLAFVFPDYLAAQHHHRSSASQNSSSASDPSENLVSFAASQSNFSTLVAALRAADLVSTLQNGGPFTVFAPTDAAFAALPLGTLEELLRPENKAQLIKILTYHVVPGRIEASDLRNGQALTTVEGRTLKVQLNGKSVGLNQALVTKANLRTGNGVIHVIDRVLLPADR